MCVYVLKRSMYGMHMGQYGYKHQVFVYVQIKQFLIFVVISFRYECSFIFLFQIIPIVDCTLTISYLFWRVFSRQSYFCVFIALVT